jgi:hypothetical protein
MKTPTWFAFSEDRPLAFFAGLWTPWTGVRGTKANPIEDEHTLFGFLTTEANDVVGAIQSDARDPDEPGGNSDLDGRASRGSTQASATSTRRPIDDRRTRGAQGRTPTSGLAELSELNI